MRPYYGRLGATADAPRRLLLDKTYALLLLLLWGIAGEDSTCVAFGISFKEEREREREIERERERAKEKEREREREKYIYIYIYI